MAVVRFYSRWRAVAPMAERGEHGAWQRHGRWSGFGVVRRQRGGGLAAQEWLHPTNARGMCWSRQMRRKRRVEHLAGRCGAWRGRRAEAEQCWHDGVNAWGKMAGQGGEFLLRCRCW